ncbi:hypothetical protein ACFLXY_05295 [Chloroflexota bacterium]
MDDEQVYSPDSFFGRYETAIRGVINTALESARFNVTQRENSFLPKMMGLESETDKSSVDDLLTCESEERCKVVSTILYNDALWRIEAAYLMMCIGLFSIAYSNLRTALESLVSGFIVARSDEQAQLFLQNDKDFKVDLKLAEALIPSGYNERIKEMKRMYNFLGVHSRFDSIQLTNLFGANRFLKFVNENTKHKKPIEFPKPEWIEHAGKECVESLGTVTVLFEWLTNISVK